MDIATRFVAASRGGDRVGSRGSRQEVAPEQGLPVLVPDFLQKDEINREATTVFNFCFYLSLYHFYQL